jgi:hypothetical protein
VVHQRAFRIFTRSAAALRHWLSSLTIDERGGFSPALNTADSLKG